MASEYTKNYNLDKYASTDKPNLRDQYNAAMDKIDAQMKTNADNITNASASVIGAVNAANEAKSAATAAQSTANDAQTTANAAAPKNHASSATTYGLATTSLYGHVKLAPSGEHTPNTGAVVPNEQQVYDMIQANIASALAPVAVISATTVTLPSPLTGSVTMSVYANPITKLVSVQITNTSGSAPSSTTSTASSIAYKNLATMPTQYRPTRDIHCDCFEGQGILRVRPTGEIRLGLQTNPWNSTTGRGYNYNDTDGASLCFYGAGTQ